MEFHFAVARGRRPVSTACGASSSALRSSSTTPELSATASVGPSVMGMPSAPSYHSSAATRAPPGGACGAPAPAASTPPPPPPSATAPTRTPCRLNTSTGPSALANSSCWPSGAHSTRLSRAPRSFAHSRAPSTVPRITVPSSYAMQISSPSARHRMSFTTLLLRLLIISSYHCFWCSTHTMMSPVASAVASLRWRAFQAATTMEPAGVGARREGEGGALWVGAGGRGAAWLGRGTDTHSCGRPAPGSWPGWWAPPRRARCSRQRAPPPASAP